MAVYSVVNVYKEMQYVWAYPALAFGWIFAAAFAFDLLGSERFSGKKLLFLTLGLVLLSSGVTHVVWVVATPRWSFSVSTDKSTYALGEPVQITVTLENHGYIPQTFTSAMGNAITVDAWSGGWTTDGYFIEITRSGMFHTRKIKLHSQYRQGSA
jgi:hypothetical protein